jgi:Glyoxalase-like domain
MSETAASPVPSVQVVLDATDPHALAEFWAAALGYQVEDVEPLVRRMLEAGHATEQDVTTRGGRLVWRDASAARDPRGQRPRLYLQRVPEPKTVKDRIHLDLHVGPDLREAEVERLLGLGATKLYDGRLGPQEWVTLADPEGNEFCVS